MKNDSDVPSHRYFDEAAKIEASAVEMVSVKKLFYDTPSLYMVHAQLLRYLYSERITRMYKALPFNWRGLSDGF